jgi:hypothetical protein
MLGHRSRKLLHGEGGEHNDSGNNAAQLRVRRHSIVH